MKVPRASKRRARIEMLPLIDIVFLLLVFFIYAMLSMAVHRAMPVVLPSSESASTDRRDSLSVTVLRDGNVFVNKTPVPLDGLADLLGKQAAGDPEQAVLLFADRNLPYGDLFRVLDRIRQAGLHRISLQAEAEPVP